MMSNVRSVPAPVSRRNSGACVRRYAANTPLLTCPSWANTLVVGLESVVKLNPAVDADHFIVACDMTSSPVEPVGLVTGPRLVTGPLQVISKLAKAGTDTGF